MNWREGSLRACAVIGALWIAGAFAVFSLTRHRSDDEALAAFIIFAPPLVLLALWCAAIWVYHGLQSKEDRNG